MKQKELIKLAKTIYKGSAIVGSDGQINPREEDISDKHIYVIVHGGPLKIMRKAKEMSK